MQNYTPIADNLVASAFVAGIPLYLLFYLLAVSRLPAHKAAPLAMVASLFVAVFAFRMPLELTLAASGLGAAGALFPILWIVVNALFLYKLTVASGRFEQVRQSLAILSPDRRIQVLFIGICFGTLMEGVAGFGVPIPLCAAMLIGVGFSPLKAAVIALLANSVPVAYGTLGTPVNSISTATQPLLGQPYEQLQYVLGATTGRQLALLGLVLPAVVVYVASGWRGLRGVLPAVLTAGTAVAVTMFTVTSYFGPALTNVLSAMVSLVSLVVLLRVWQPGDTLPHPLVRPIAGGSGGSVALGTALAQPMVPTSPRSGLTLRQALSGWMPFLLLSATIIAGVQAPVARLLDTVSLRFAWPLLHNAIAKAPPIISPDQIGTAIAFYPATFTVDWLRSASSLTLIAALVAGPLMGLGLREMASIYVKNIRELRGTLISVTCMLALSSVMNYSGMSASLALVLMVTGGIFPFFASYIGWFGVFLTGSDTAACNLFGGLQVIAAQQLGLSPVLTAATNCAGGTVGKMISPQALAIATGAVGLTGAEGEILRRVVKWSVAMAAFLGLVSLLMAYLLPGTVVPLT